MDPSLGVQLANLNSPSRAEVQDARDRTDMDKEETSGMIERSQRGSRRFLNMLLYIRLREVGTVTA